MDYSKKKKSLFRYSASQNGIVPLFQQKISLILIPLFLFTPQSRIDTGVRRTLKTDLFNMQLIEKVILWSFI